MMTPLVRSKFCVMFLLRLACAMCTIHSGFHDACILAYIVAELNHDMNLKRPGQYQEEFAMDFVGMI